MPLVALELWEQESVSYKYLIISLVPVHHRASFKFPGPPLLAGSWIANLPSSMVSIALLWFMCIVPSLMILTVPVKHVTELLPAISNLLILVLSLPYQQTYREPVSDYQVLREKAASQRRDVERALTRFMAKTGETQSLFKDDVSTFPCKRHLKMYRARHYVNG